MMMYWVAGLLLFSIFTPWLEHTIEQKFQILPVHLDLVRSLRYTIPLIFMIAFFILIKVTGSQNGFPKLAVYGILGYLYFQVSIICGQSTCDFIYGVNRAVISGEENSYHFYTQRLKILDYIKSKTEESKLFLVLTKSFLPEALRYYSNRSLAHNSREISSVRSYYNLQLAVKTKKRHFQPFISSAYRKSSTVNRSYIKYYKFKPDYVIYRNKLIILPEKPYPIVYQNYIYIVANIDGVCIDNE